MKTVGYLRLSKEDGDNESSSITNQRKMLTEYAQNNGLNITKFYIDDGVSGYTMDRPEFNKLKKALNEDEIDTIIIKDLSRLGRHNAKVQLFLENIQETGKRLIAINDNYDTYDEDSMDFSGINTWINERYIRDTSKKIRKSIAVLQKEGKWICSVPFGYKKDLIDKNKYYVDPITAPYVKRIFELYISGMGLKSVAKTLTEENVPTPSMIKKQQQEAKGLTSKRKPSGKWDCTVISRILQNDFYIGTLTLGKSKTRSINGRSVPQPEEERHIFKNAHEAIIDKQTFKLTQEITKERAFGDYRGRKIQVRDNIFSGLLYCADCGKKLTSAGGKNNNTRYLCRTYNIYGTSLCTSHAVSEDDLKYSLIEFLKHCRNNLYKVIDDIDNIIKAEIEVKSSRDESIESLHKLLEKTKKEVEILIEQKIRETMKNPTMVEMIDKMYSEMQNEKYKEMQILEKQINDQQLFAIDEMEIKNNLNSALNIINEIIESESLTKKQVLILIDRIVVHEDSGIDIYLKGNLHKLTNNYFRLSESRMDKIKKYMCEYILDNQEKFTTNEVTVYVREKGIKLTYETISKILKQELLADELIEIRKMNHGYRFISTKEKLESKLLNNIVASISRWLCNNNDKFNFAMGVNEWIKCDNINKNNQIKYLF